MSKYIPLTPTPKQTAFLLAENDEVLWGGAAGGGKSVALLMGALQYVDLPRYHSLILRKTYQELSLPGALIDMSHEWLAGTDAKWEALKNKWTFPSKSTLTFGYLEHTKDKYRYQGANFHYVGVDELTTIDEESYIYIFSRMRRRKADMDFPVRMRAASNPGAEWVYNRFINPDTKEDDAVFISAKLQDNPHIDQDSYIKMLDKLDPVTKAQLLNGQWITPGEGQMFKRYWFQVVDENRIPVSMRKVRYWDLASTVKSRGSKDPDYTVGLLLGITPDNLYYILDVQRDRLKPHDVEQLVARTAAMDGIETAVRMEEEPGSSGKIAIDNYRRNILPAYDFDGIRSTGDKIVRASPISGQAGAGNVYVLAGRWNKTFFDELEMFPDKTAHDDQVDALSGAHQFLAEAGSRRLRLVI